MKVDMPVFLTSNAYRVREKRKMNRYASFMLSIAGIMPSFASLVKLKWQVASGKWSVVSGGE